MTAIIRHRGETEIGGGAAPVESASSQTVAADRVGRESLGMDASAAGAAAPVVVPVAAAPPVLRARWGWMPTIGHLGMVAVTSASRIFASRTLPPPPELSDPAFIRAADDTGFGNVRAAIYSLRTNSLLGSVTQPEVMEAIRQNLLQEQGTRIAIADESPYLQSGAVEIEVQPISDGEIQEEITNKQVTRDQAIKNLVKKRMEEAKNAFMRSSFPSLTEAPQAAAVSVGVTGVVAHNVCFYVNLTVPPARRVVEYFNSSSVTIPPTDIKPTVVSVKIEVRVDGESSPRRLEQPITLGEVAVAFQAHVGAAPEFAVVEQTYQKDWHNCMVFVAIYILLRAGGVSFADLSTGARGKALATSNPLTHRQTLVDELVKSVQRTMRQRAPADAEESVRQRAPADAEESVRQRAPADAEEIQSDGEDAVVTFGGECTIGEDS